jgi:hypothetical protein
MRLLKHHDINKIPGDQSKKEENAVLMKFDRLILESKSIHYPNQSRKPGTINKETANSLDEIHVRYTGKLIAKKGLLAVPHILINCRTQEKPR